MFGGFYILLIIILAVCGGIKAIYENGRLREKGLERKKKGENSGNLWMDRMGCLRDLDTGAVRKLKRNGRQDTILMDENGNVIKNINLEKRIMDAAKRAAEAENGVKAVYFETWDRRYSQISRKNDLGTMLDEVHGEIYKDIKTGELYIKRNFHWYDNDMSQCPPIRTDMGNPHRASFYMNLKGYLVSKSDQPLYHATEEDCQKFIEYFNQKQKEGGWAMHRYSLENKYLSNFYCNNYM